MAASTAEDIYQLIQKLPVVERLRLVERIAHDLSSTEDPARPAFDWSSLAGAAPGLLGGQDAQAWVSSSRSEADDARDARFGRTP